MFNAQHCSLLANNLKITLSINQLLMEEKKKRKRNMAVSRRGGGGLGDMWETVDRDRDIWESRVDVTLR